MPGLADMLADKKFGGFGNWYRSAEHKNYILMPVMLYRVEEKKRKEMRKEKKLTSLTSSA